ncbi:MAG: AAA family ATPase [Pseudomonadota bacterium]
MLADDKELVDAKKGKDLAMKLTALLVSHYKGISEEIKILIDDIVVLVGPNNCCKSSILDAYDSYYSLGSSSLSLDYFHNHSKESPIIITGVFTDLTDEDVDKVGKEWVVQADIEYGDCAKFQIRWEEPGEKGTKYSFSNITKDWKKGGAGGWDTILKSRLPLPIRVNPNDSTEDLEKVLKDLIVKSAQEKIKNDKSKLSKIISEIEILAKEVESEISAEIQNLNAKIELEVKKLFEDITVGFETGVGKFKPEDAIKDGSRFMLNSSGSNAPLAHQGSGVQRAFLWSAINAMCSEGKYKKGRNAIDSSKPKILLLDEPEINLHPSVIRAARKAIYALSEIDGWQVMCTTHSPVFIDLTYNHTTLIKISNTQSGVFYFQTDKASFSDDERDNLKMLNKCCPTVNEFFFYKNAILVEGDTEYLTYQYLIERENLQNSHCVINCRGKGNLPTFVKIFNQFQASAIVLHDLDDEVMSNGNRNPMWTINTKIREQADQTDERVVTVAHNPDFEGYYLDEKPLKDKPYNIFTHLRSESFETDPKYQKLRESLSSIIDGSHEGIYRQADQLKKVA